MKKTIKERSGNVNDENRLTCLLYLLMRDQVPCGVVERIVQTVENNDDFQFSNGWLAHYAKDLSERITSRSIKSEDVIKLEPEMIREGTLG